MSRELGKKVLATILVVDDDPEMRAVLRDLLQREGYRVLEESCGEWAIATVEFESVDLIILDKELPRMSGLELLSFLRRRHPDTPVILITAFGGPMVREEAKRLGAERYLEKPFRVTELFETVREVVRRPERACSADGRK